MSVVKSTKEGSGGRERDKERREKFGFFNSLAASRV